ncbi:MAG TPA: NUDIX hydrolase [Thermoanaerobaculia bacterium]|jgi:predicted NUDIX family phosphoesterase
MSEEVMVVRRADLSPYIDGHELGLIVDAEPILEVINDRHLFLPRDVAEVSPEYKQIIPYVIVRHGSSYFLLQRTSKQTEARLHHKLSLGIGGHINPDTPELLDGLWKELDEEVHIEGDYELTFAGILNDDTTEVGRVHLGAVFMLEAESLDVRVLETEKMTGTWTSREELTAKREAMETWSALVFDRLIAT